MKDNHIARFLKERREMILAIFLPYLKERRVRSEIFFKFLLHLNWKRKEKEEEIAKQDYCQTWAEKDNLSQDDCHTWFERERTEMW